MFSLSEYDPMHLCKFVGKECPCNVGKVHGWQHHDVEKCIVAAVKSDGREVVTSNPTLENWSWNRCQNLRVAFLGHVHHTVELK